MKDTVVTQFTGGIGNVEQDSILASLPVPSPSTYVQLEDFDTFSDQASWVEFTDFAGTVTQVPGFSTGLLRLFVDTAQFGEAYVQSTGLPLPDDEDAMTMRVGQPMWFSTRFLTDNLELLFWEAEFGLVPNAGGASSTVPPANGCWFAVDEDDATLFLRTDKAGGSPLSVAIGTLELRSFYTASWYWDGVNTVIGELIKENGTGNSPLPGSIRVGAGKLTLDVATDLPVTQLNPIALLKNPVTTTVLAELFVDYLFCAVARQGGVQVSLK